MYSLVLWSLISMYIGLYMDPLHQGKTTSQIIEHE